MPEPQQEVLQSFLGGMNSNIDPQLLTPEKYAFGLNITSRGGLVKTRPPFVKVATTPAIATGKFQGAALYRLNDVDRIVFGVAGRVYALRLDTLAVTDHGLLLSPTVDRFFFVQADRYLIVQDGDPAANWAAANWPVIIYEDGLIDQSANTAYERVPKGGPMAYGHGRLFVSTHYVLENAAASPAWVDKGRVGWMAGDIKQPHDPTTILNFKETWDLDQGGRFDLPEEIGFITAMAFQQNVMSGVGQGPLIIWAKNGASAYMVNASRTNWKDIDFGVVLFSGVQMYSPLSLVGNNSDILYRAGDGVRTLAQTSSVSEGKGLSNNPISEPVDTIFDNDTIATLPLVSGAKHNDRLFWTAVPDTATDTFKSIVSLDVKPIASMEAEARPVWDGVWTGFNFHHIISGIYNNKNTLFAFTRSQGALNGLYRLDEGDYIDQGSSRPVARLYTSYLQFETGLDMKRLDYLDLWISDVEGQVDITGFYRSDHYPLWVQMDSGSVNSNPTGLNQRYRKLRLAIPGASESDADKNLLDRGTVFQFCIQWTGKMKLDKALAEATLTDVNKERVLASESGTQTSVVATATQLDLDNYSYRIV